MKILMVFLNHQANNNSANFSIYSINKTKKEKNLYLKYLVMKIQVNKKKIHKMIKN